MSRHAKLFVATLATVIAATFGTMGVATTADAGDNNRPSYKDRSWCC